MTAEIHRLILGACNCYLIKEQGLILVDTGSPNRGYKFQKELIKLSIEPEDISLILLTHGHQDHSCWDSMGLLRLFIPRDDKLFCKYLIILLNRTTRLQEIGMVKCI